MDYLPLNINVSAESFTKSYLEALNGILKLTDTELQVLSVFLNYSKDEAGGKESRMHVRNILSFSRSNVYNYLKRLEEKGCLVKNEDASYRYNPVVVPRASGLVLNFVIADGRI